MDAVSSPGFAPGHISAMTVIVFISTLPTIPGGVVIYRRPAQAAPGGTRDRSGSSASSHEAGQIGRRCVIYGTSGRARDHPGSIRREPPEDCRILPTTIPGRSIRGWRDTQSLFGHLVAMINAVEVDCVAVNNRIADVERLQPSRRCQHMTSSSSEFSCIRTFHVASQSGRGPRGCPPYSFRRP